MAVVASLVANLEANVANFTSNMDKAARSVQGLKKDISLIKFDALINLGERAFHAAERMFAFGKSVASSANDIQRQAGIIGVSIEQWQKLTYAAKMADATTEGLMLGLKNLSMNIAESNTIGSQADKIFKVLGITSRDLTTVMYELADRFSSSNDAQGKMAYGQALLGKGALELNRFMELGSRGIKNYGEEAQKMGTILGDVVFKKGSEVDDMFKRLDARINAAKISLAPWIETFVKGFESIYDKVQAVLKLLEKLPGYGTSWNMTRGVLPPGPGESISEKLGLTKGVEHPGIMSEQLLSTHYKPPLPAFPSGMEDKNKKIIEDQHEAFLKSIQIFYDEKDKIAEIFDTHDRDRIMENVKIQEEQNQGLLRSIGISYDEKKEIADIFDNYEVDQIMKNAEIRKEQDEAYLESLKIYLEQEQEMRDIAAKINAENTLKNIEKVEKERAEFMAKGIGGAVEVLLSSVQNLKNGWQGFFQTMTQGFAKLMQEIAAAIIKAQVLAMIPKSWGGTGISWFGGGGSMGPGAYGWGGYEQGFAGGGSFLTSGPTRFLAGEGGEPEQVNITPLSRMGKNGGGTTINIETYINQIEATDVNSFEKKYEGSIKKVVRNHHRKQTSWRGGI